MDDVDHDMQAFTKIINPGKIEINGKLYNVYCKISYSSGNLSITGVVGPTKGGNCEGSCGQIVDELSNISVLDELWAMDDAMIHDFIDIWRLWHLNDMRPYCVHQNEAKWSEKRIDPLELPHSRANRDDKGILATWVTPDEHRDGLLTKACPVCGYKYGTAWLKEEVPTDVLKFLSNLPDCTVMPEWV